MVNQTLISFKCDSSQLELFDALCIKLGCKRNKLLNFLVSYANITLNEPNKLALLCAYNNALSVFDV